MGKALRNSLIVEDMASASIGQSVVLVTPLQLARAYAVFANGGYLITPHLVDANINWRSEKYLKKVDIEDKTLETIRRGLRKVVTSGTAMGINLDNSILLPSLAKLEQQKIVVEVLIMHGSLDLPLMIRGNSDCCFCSENRWVQYMLSLWQKKCYGLGRAKI